MIRSVLAWLALSAGTAAAQSIPVRTAEHDGFTRIAIDFASGADWQLEQDGRNLRIRTEDIATYDLGDVYRRIRPDRISAFRQASPNELVVELACACSPETFRHGNSLVLDISPSVANPTAPTSRPEPKPAPAPTPDAPSRDKILLPGLLTRGIVAGEDGETAVEATGVQSERAAALRARLAADLGLAPEPRLADQEEPIVETDSDIETEERRPGQLLVESRTARDTRGYDEVISRAVCPAFAEETLQSWAISRQTVSPDVGDEAWIAAEAKRLAALGFGLEASQLLETTGIDDHETRLLTNIAQLVDTPVPAPEIASVADCGDILSLFALISDPPVQPQRIGSVLDALSATPQAARPNLERRAVAGLLGLGRREDAQLVASAGKRRETIAAPPNLTSINLAAGGDAAPAEDLEDIVTRRTPEAGAAIRMMVDGMVDDDTPVPPVLLDQARTFLPEITGSDRHRLERAIIRAEINAGQYLRAAKGIDALAKRDETMAKRLDEELFTTIHSIEDDALFLTQIISFGDRPIPDPETRLAIATRVAKNHIPKVAIRILSRGTEIPSTNERLLRASLALKTKDADEAEAHLTDLEHPEADVLRRQIGILRAEQLPPMEDPAPSTPNGLRARSNALVEQSATLRAELEQFLGN